MWFVYVTGPRDYFVGPYEKRTEADADARAIHNSTGRHTKVVTRDGKRQIERRYGG